MCGYNCCFIIEKGSFVESMATTGGELTQRVLTQLKQRGLQVLLSKKDSTLENTRPLSGAF